MERAAGEFRAIHEAVVVLDYFKDLPDPRRLGKVTYPLGEWQYRAERRRSSISRGSARRRSVFSAGSGRFAMERLHTITSENCEDNPRPPRYTPLSRSRRPRDQRRKWKHWVTSSLSTVRRTAEGGWLCSM